jgi:hypothetical protein
MIVGLSLLIQFDQPQCGAAVGISCISDGGATVDVVVVVGVAVKEKKIKNKKMMISIFIC